jgi:hypothetical protein
MWQPELLSQESLVEVEDELRVRYACQPALVRFAVTKRAIPRQNSNGL